jgi:hypothetical protein
MNIKIPEDLTPDSKDRLKKLEVHLANAASGIRQAYENIEECAELESIRKEIADLYLSISISDNKLKDFLYG